MEFHGAQLLKQIAGALQDLYRKAGFDRVVLAGTEETAKEFEGMLPEPVGRRVIGRLGVDFKQESDEEILERANGLVAEDERTAEMALVQQVIDYADAGGQGAIGVEDTLRAVFEGRSDTLAVAEGFTKEGALCPNCGYFAGDRFERCPACDAAAAPLEDVIEHAVAQMYLSSGSVNTVFGPAREDLLSRGGIGALLRY